MDFMSNTNPPLTCIWAPAEQTLGETGQCSLRDRTEWRAQHRVPAGRKTAAGRRRRTFPKSHAAISRRSPPVTISPSNSAAATPNPAPGRGSRHAPAQHPCQGDSGHPGGPGTRPFQQGCPCPFQLATGQVMGQHRLQIFGRNAQTVLLNHVHQADASGRLHVHCLITRKCAVCDPVSPTRRKMCTPVGPRPDIPFHPKETPQAPSIRTLP